MRRYYVGKAWEMSFSLPSLCHAYFTDLVDESSADMVYWAYLVVAAFSSFLGSMLVASKVIGDDHSLYAVIISLVLIGTALLLCFIFLPESVAPSASLNSFLAAGDAHNNFGRATYLHWIRPFENMYASFRLLPRNPNLTYVILVYAVFELIQQRDSELELQFLQEVAGFGTVEQSTYLMIRFLVVTCVYSVIFPFWSLFSNRTYKDAFGFGFVMVAVKLFGMIFVESKMLAYFLEVFGAMDALITVMIHHVIDHHSTASSSPTVHEAVLGVRSLAQGLSPLFHASLFALFRAGDIYFPRAPFISLFCLALAGLLLLLNIRVEKYGFVTPVSIFLRIITLTFHSDDEDLDNCINMPVSGRGYISEEDSNNSTSTTATSTDEDEPLMLPLENRFD